MIETSNVSHQMATKSPNSAKPCSAHRNAPRANRRLARGSAVAVLELAGCPVERSAIDSGDDAFVGVAFVGVVGTVSGSSVVGNCVVGIPVAGGELGFTHGSLFSGLCIAHRLFDQLFTSLGFELF